VELGRTVYLLGARPDAVAACRDRLLRDHPRLKIVGFHHGYFAPGEEEAVVAHINACRPDILLVGFGTPLQEEWISRNARRLDAGVCMAVGGLFDFLSGTFARAPVWMRRAGIEWLFRFLKDPAAKWNRVFLEIPLFLTLVVARRIVPRQIRTLYARRMGFR
jgi:N-acetylglucosaminyldiphosphoundecaprenol N-acetyl-beta-D-mannosaminyltransferase